MPAGFKSFLHKVQYQPVLTATAFHYMYFAAGSPTVLRNFFVTSSITNVANFILA